VEGHLENVDQVKEKSFKMLLKCWENIAEAAHKTQ
jgi:hypothetical protein